MIYLYHFSVKLLFILLFTTQSYCNDILGCGGFVKSHVNLDFSKIEVSLYTKEGSLKEKTECAPTNGYYFLPLYEKGDYILKVNPPAGWSFEPQEVEVSVNGETDVCSTGQDINFSFNGFGITGRVITAGQSHGPSGVNVQLVNDKGSVRNAITTIGGDFHFTPVIPGKYTIKASHSRWKLDPAQAVVQVKEGNTALPVGVLAVKGYDVSGSITSFGNPIDGVYVLLYSKEEKPKFRVEGCKTALLQGVPDAPICYSVTQSSGEFNFGLVPAGDYKLLAMSKTPGQNTITYNIKPKDVSFNVQHDSIYIKNAFEVTGFNVVGAVLKTMGGDGMPGVRVLLDGEPVATTDATGQYALKDLKPNTYTLKFQHEEAEIDEIQVRISSGGLSGTAEAVAARWRVCGELRPPAPRALLLAAATGRRTARAGDDGKWCTFLPPGTYTVKVEVSEQEQREGLQYFPESRQVVVRGGAVGGVWFSVVRARVAGRVECGRYCGNLQVALRPLAPDGTYMGPPIYTDVVEGAYAFEEVVPGSVELSVPAERLCWAEERLNVAVTSDLPAVPPFQLRALKLDIDISHAATVEYSVGSESGAVPLEAGRSSVCVPAGQRCRLTPTGCHQFQPPHLDVDMVTGSVPMAVFVAVAHAAAVRVVAPVAAADLRLRLARDGGPEEIVPLTPVKHGVEYIYEHVMYLPEGSVVEVSAESAALVVRGGGGRVVGAGECRARALELRAAAAVTLAGRLRPPVARATLTLTADNDDLTLVQVTDETGVYSFGPLDASKQYTITAEKDSYVFGERQENGDITAHKLAEINVKLVDKADQSPLEGALVSVSGGQFRRTAGSDAGGRVRAGALAPAQYYVRPHMKEFRFHPPHATLSVADGETHHLLFSGVRVAWSALGRVSTLGGAGVGGGGVRAVPTPTHTHTHTPACAPLDATTADDGAFRIRGLLPECEYVVELKEAAAPGLAGLKLVKAPPPIKVSGGDATDLRLVVHVRQDVTDGAVVVRASAPDHYRSLKLTLAPDGGAPLYTARLDPPTGPLGAGVLLALPRLAADNATYVLTVDSALPRTQYAFDDMVYYFTSDGQYKFYEIYFEPKARSAEQEMRAGGALVVPALALVALLVAQRHRLPHLANLITSYRSEHPNKKTAKKKNN